jgi:hypothetical protein
MEIGWTDVSQLKNVDSPLSKKAKVTKSLGKNMFISLKHPPYSPDLAPMDFAVSPTSNPSYGE